jgi:flagellar assembly protein FliH
MSTVIKNASQGNVAHRVAFNLEDISHQANNYLDQVRVQAAQIVVEAQKQADAVRRNAEEQGKQAAMSAVERVLDEKVGKRLESLLPALQQAIRDLADARQSWLQHWEKCAVRLSCAIAEKIIRRQIESHPEITIELVRESLEMSGGSPQIQIQMHPTDVETLGSQVERLVKEFGRVATAQIVADSSISLGGCRVETQHGTIDQQIEAQLARIEAELTGNNND